MQPFNGLEKFKQRCAEFDKPKEPFPQSEPEIVPIQAVTVTPRTGLFDIYKRSTDLSINQCVSIGFTYNEAFEFIKKRVKVRESNNGKCVIYYDIVAQDNVEQKNPLWNPKELTKEGGTYTNWSVEKPEYKLEWQG